jgi:hypothetical protein
MNSLSEHFFDHIEALERLALAGDELATRSLACMALLIEGWRYGDPDPVDSPPDGGGEVINLDLWRNAA